MELFVATFLKMFFIMTPFFVLSVFLTMTSDATTKEKKTLAVKVTLSVIIISLILLFFGKHIFAVFGITLDAFRIGAGALLFLTAVDLIRGSKDGQKVDAENIQDLAVVPLAIPITIGPGTIGILLVMGAGFKSAVTLFLGSFALVCAVSLIGLMLYFSHTIRNVVGKQGLLVVSKITGLFLAALSAQTMFTGIKNFLNM
ncbi:MarC family protein [Halarcobacter anaerophilus]|jgi:multiple antibiotic resistance protein|uniref:UPF0056 membrane protein n=1 Tax=Halarcobacter anaerophilus TaxID=877500 RepID=A0A4Q0Y1Y8_9BACT|nr:MarC family protein [Halarcobacter anaerophilus]QDF30197.1 MarC family membrane protein [Halarcobacter anaerophilus]RXJ62241.1 MarC family protein [Halarcobacter anaerophilus]